MGRFTHLHAHGRSPTSAGAPAKNDASVRAAVVPDIVNQVVDTLGHRLDPAILDYMESRFAHDFSHVRVHTDERASASAQAIGAPAYTVGSHVAFGAGNYAPQTGAGRRLLAHELVHVVQQANSVDSGHNEGLTLWSAPSAEHEAVAASRAALDGALGGGLGSRTGSQPVLQRYEAGEHVQFGEAGDALKELVGKQAFQYKVKPGEMPRVIAAKFGVTEEDLRAANSDKLRTWKATSPAGGTVRGFDAGDMILIPPAINDTVREALKTKELSFTLGGESVDYGQGIAMGDLFKDPEHILAAPDATLKELKDLIQKDKPRPGAVTAEEWDRVTGPVTGGKFSDLALHNESHFAPSNPALATVSGKSTADNKSSWEKYHALAISESQAGHKDKALAINAFADHFLTDAFASGHLFNKRDVMETFNRQLPVDAKGKFTPASVAFFDVVAARAFTGAVKTEFSKYETVTYEGGFFRPNINSDSRFSKLLQGIHSKEPDILSSVAAKAVHDTLNREPGGVEVENNMGDKWTVSGDASLNDIRLNAGNADTLRIGRKAVAQSQLDVLSAFKAAGPISLPAVYKSVWDYVPHPTAAGTATVSKEITTGTDPTSTALIKAVADLIISNYRLILTELVARGYLKRA